MITEPMRRWGYIRDTQDERDLMFRTAGKVLKDLPNRTDSLVKHLPPVIDQMNIGVCTGVSASRAAKTLMNSTGYKWPHMPSALFLYAATRELEGESLWVDSGCMIRDVFKVWNTGGVCPEDSNPSWSWPFSVSDDRWRTKPPKACYDAAQNHKITYMRLGLDPAETKSALVQGFPVVIGIAVHESMQSRKVAKTGVIPKPSRFGDTVLGGHAMFLWGFGNYRDDHADGRNSWSNSWGSQGNFHINFRELSNPEFCNDRWAICAIT